MRLTAALYALLDPEPDNAPEGGWTREQLLDMHERFVTALERAFELGLEHRASAAAQVALPASPGPRWSSPLCPAVSSGLLRSAENALAFVARR
jgi:hypothetical protein